METAAGFGASGATRGVEAGAGVEGGAAEEIGAEVDAAGATAATLGGLATITTQNYKMENNLVSSQEFMTTNSRHLRSVEMRTYSLLGEVTVPNSLVVS